MWTKHEIFLINHSEIKERIIIIYVKSTKAVLWCTNTAEIQCIEASQTERAGTIGSKLTGHLFLRGTQS